jgi:hypothetical protein
MLKLLIEVEVLQRVPYHQNLPYIDQSLQLKEEITISLNKRLVLT